MTPAHATAGRRVLVADDQADVVAALRLLLRPAGFDVDTASSVEEVRTRLADGPYDLLLLPSSLPQLPGCEMAASWQPARTCSGDCYDAVPIDDPRVALSIADVAGKGLPAALVMAHLQASIRAFCGENPSPDRVMSSANRALCRNAELGLFVTCVYAVVDRAARRPIYTNAGHNPPILVRADGRIERLSDGGMVLGMFDRSTYVSREVALDAGDCLVLFTDGIVEALNGEDVEFGDDRLIGIAVRHRHAAPQALVDAVVLGVSQFTAGTPPADDATVVCVGF